VYNYGRCVSTASTPATGKYRFLPGLSWQTGQPYGVRRFPSTLLNAACPDADKGMDGPRRCIQNLFQVVYDFFELGRESYSLDLPAGKIRDLCKPFHSPPPPWPPYPPPKSPKPPKPPRPTWPPRPPPKEHHATHPPKHHSVHAMYHHWTGEDHKGAEHYMFPGAHRAAAPFNETEADSDGR
jgi:hypothetical protein